MRFLQVGLGSMGKRRIRCLQSLGYRDVVAFDLRADRRAEAAEKYGVKTTDSLDAVDFGHVDALIVSTPPDRHDPYIRLAIEQGKPVFVEASVVVGELPDLDRLAAARGVLVAPSCTMRFHPAIQDIRRLARGGAYGKITTFTYYLGQYLPDWHPWESVRDQYVSKRETGGAREMVAFELTWLTDVVAHPKQIFGYCGRTMDVGADIEDSYAMTLDCGGVYGTLMIDVVARYAMRSLILNLERGQILWRWDENIVHLYEADSGRWVRYESPRGQAAQGYNKNIIENMYIDELNAFIQAAQGTGTFPNTLAEDVRVLRLIEAVEGGGNAGR